MGVLLQGSIRFVLHFVFQNSLAFGERISSTEDDVGVGMTRALRRTSPKVVWVTEGDFNVYNTFRCFACNVAAGIFRIPRCRWADSSSADNSPDFFSGALL